MASSLLMKAHRPALTVAKDATVMDAIMLMVDRGVGAAVVLENQRAIGMFTERDVMVKVVLQRLDPMRTRVSAVMASPVVPIDANAEVAEALRLMLDRHIRHLPVVDRAGCVLGVLSIRHLLTDQIALLEQEVGALANYIAADGSGG